MRSEGQSEAPAGAAGADAERRIAELLQRRFGVALEGYKPATVRRRIERRPGEGACFFADLPNEVPAP